MYLLFLLFALFTNSYLAFSQKHSKIAIIGGGIGGTSCAYFLKELFNEETLSLTVFEKDAIGGRLRTIEISGEEYEAGGSIIHPRNHYMVKFSKLLKLGLQQPPSGKLGIFNGNQFVFEESDWYFITIAKMIWHYGLSMFYLFKDVKSMLNDFSRIYNIQEKGYAFTSVDRLLDSMNLEFTNMTKQTLLEVLLQKGYSGAFLDELVQSIMMVNYGQTNNISGFAGYVSLAGAESNLWSVEGGNKLVPEGLLKLSQATYENADVSEVKLLPDNTYSVTYQEMRNNNVKSKSFDFVILTAPLTQDNTIKFVGFQEDFERFQRPFHQTVTVFVKGTLNPLVFNQKSVPEEILTNNSSFIFNSLSKVSPVKTPKRRKPVEKDEKEDVYKMFRQKAGSVSDVMHYFKKTSVIKEKVWQAYPHYKPPENFVPFVLHQGLYYTNAIESAASAMEMSAIAAKNVALLLYNSWKKDFEKNDPLKILLKDEL